MTDTTKATSSPSHIYEERYRLLKFTDARDPRHSHLYPISGSFVEDYESSHKPRRRRKRRRQSSSEDDAGRMLEMTDNWCLLSRDVLLDGSKEDEENDDGYEGDEKGWTRAPYPHGGHPVLYVPGHWGSYMQSRSLGAHGTRWTGQRRQHDTGMTMSDRDIYDSLRTGEGMHDGLGILHDHDYDGTGRNNSSSSSSYRRRELDGFVMDVYALDFDEEGAALHSSTLFRQAEFFARAVRTIAMGCRLPAIDGGGIRDDDDDDDEEENSTSSRGGGITIVAHSIGALVVRMALRAHPQLSANGWIRNIITLASPLGSEFPYAVDAGVHDVARLVNDGGGGGGGGGNRVAEDVMLISISGGLRDEMIPPGACQVPPISGDTDRNDVAEKASGFASSAFLSSSMMRGSDSSTEDGPFGMDHRAIVWCYELLSKVRELVFSLVVATDNGLVSSERTNVAVGVIYGARDGLGYDPRWNESDAKVYQEQVNEQHLRLLLEKGYWTTVSIQLSAPYYLNSLLKLCIAAALLDTFARFRTSDRHGRTPPSTKSYESFIEATFDMALSLLAIPSIVVVVTWARQSSHSCFGQECNILLGTVFILSQLATMAYLLIVRGLCRFGAAFFKPCVNFARAEYHPTKMSCRGIFLRQVVKQLSMLALLILPLTATVGFIINSYILETEDLAWDGVAIGSYCYISFILHNLIFMAILSTHSPLTAIEERRGEIIVLFLSLLKSTFGTVLHAFSLTTHWGQLDFDSWNECIHARSNVLITSAITIVLPTFLTITVLRSQDEMTQKLLFLWRQTKQKNSESDAANGSANTELESASKVLLWSCESKPIILVRAVLVCWFTWTASVSINADDLVIPISVVVITCLRFLRFSDQVVDVCSAVIVSDLSLNHDKYQ
jgi:hypothetical protein